MKTIPEFLAHAIALESQTAERYDELAGAMEVHHNTEVAELFHRMARYARMHLAEVNDHAIGLPLPHYAPWEYEWGEGEEPENFPHQDAHYKMTPFHALKAALKAEISAQDFYATVAADAEDLKLKALASAYAQEEGEHVLLLQKWLQEHPAPDEGWDHDMDPPSSGE